MYSKIFKSINRICFFTLLAVILISFFASLGFSGGFSWKLLLILILVSLFLYPICVVFSDMIAENIANIIENIDVDSNERIKYPELQPIIKKIAAQNNEIKRQVQRVKRQKMRLQAISENMNEGLIVLGRENEIISANKSACKIFNETEPMEYKPFPLISGACELSGLMKEAEKGEKQSAICEIKDKSYRVFLSPVLENGEVSGMIILLFDISEEVKNIRIRREFSANVSHELKTPLTTILGYSQIINNGIARPEDVNGFMGKIEKETSRMIGLVDDIIKLSKLDEEQTEEQESVDLYEIACETAELLGDKAAKRGISINVTGGEYVLTANKSQVQELFYNLCDNAIKYNKENGQVLVHVSSGGFSVSDTGIGIPDEYKERIFERFFRVDKSRSKTVQGTGLGLSIVKHIVLQMGGRITVKDGENIGTVFTVTFN